MTYIQRRKEKRLSSLNLSHFYCLDENDQIRKQGIGRTINVSTDGMLLETADQIEERYLLKLTLGLEERIVNLRGRIIHFETIKKDRFQYGIVFQEIDETMKLILREFIQAFNLQN